MLWSLARSLTRNQPSFHIHRQTDLFLAALLCPVLTVRPDTVSSLLRSTATIFMHALCLLLELSRTEFHVRQQTDTILDLKSVS